MDEVEIPRLVLDTLIDPEVPIDPHAALPEPEQASTWPAPLVTSVDPAPDGVVFPGAVKLLETKLTKLGYEHRTGYAYGFKPGRIKDTWAPIETVGVWARAAGKTSVVFTWERSPDSTAKGGPAWKAQGALFHARGLARLFKHTEAKGML
jgi:hypothetical protein